MIAKIKLLTPPVSSASWASAISYLESVIVTNINDDALDLEETVKDGSDGYINGCSPRRNLEVLTGGWSLWEKARSVPGRKESVSSRVAQEPRRSKLLRITPMTN